MIDADLLAVVLSAVAVNRNVGVDFFGFACIFLDFQGELI